MSDTQTKTITIFAPAKINLYLHITGRLNNGYHTLDSLTGFIDVGDEVIIKPADGFQFEAAGPFAKAFGPKELDSSPNSANLVVQAVWALAQAAQKKPDVHVKLTKNLPIASGIGGGSSDAAAVIWGLLEFWGIPANSTYLPGLLAKLGADIPACLMCEPVRMRGIGDILDPAPAMPEMPILLVNPGVPCSTRDVFLHYNANFKEPIALPDDLSDRDRFILFLAEHSNDLLTPALEIAPPIENVLNQLSKSENCLLARMCGSGATCFGLFSDEGAAEKAMRDIQEENPDWWLKTGILNRPERY